MSLKNWAYICLNNYCVASIQGNTYISYERFIRMHFGELGDMPIGRITNLMVQNHITKLSCLVDENGLSENYLTCLRRSKQNNRYFLPTRTNDKENMEKQFRSKSMSSIEIAEFESLKTIGIPQFLGFSKQNRSYNCFLCGLAGKIPTFLKTSKVCKTGEIGVKQTKKTQKSPENTTISG